MVAEVTTGQREKFSVVSVDPTQRHPDGGCKATVISLHLSREEADRAVEDSQ